MADEPIGSVNVSIGGDYSQLIADFQETVKEAQSAGKEVAEAFTSAAEGEQALEEAFQKLLDAGYTVNEAMEQFQSMLEQVQAAEAATATSTDAAGEAAKSAAADFAEFGSAADRAARDAVLFGESAQEIVNSQRQAEAELKNATEALDQIRVAYSLGEASANDLARAEAAVKNAFNDANPALVEAQRAAAGVKEETASVTDKLVALGSALAVTAALQEFGETALQLAIEQEQLVISLEALTGSAEEAKLKLEEIDEFSFSNALEIDTVEAVTQKMTAFKFSTEETSKVLQAAADTSAATGGSFESTAEKLANMAKSGVAGARQLTSLGISIDDLGKQMNVMGSDAAKAFKELDQSERIKVLTGALDQFAGTAAAVANSTGGQFQNLKNDVHNLFETMGGELLPIANQVLGVLRDDVLPAIKALTEWFANLPGPIKEVVIDAGLLTAAVVPLVGAVTAASLAFDGLKTVVPLVSGLLKTLGMTALTTAAQEEVATGATAALGKAAAVTSGELGAVEAAAASLGSLLGFALVAGGTAAVVSLTELRSRLDSAHQSVKGLTDEDFATWLQKSAAEVKNTADAVQVLEGRLKTLTAMQDMEVISMADFAKGAGEINKKLEEIKKQEIHDVLSKFSVGLTILSGEASKAHDEISLLRGSLADAEKQLQKTEDRFNAGKASYEDYAAASKKVTDLQGQLSAALADTEAKAKLTTLAYDEWKASLGESQSAMLPYIDSVEQLASRHDILIASEETARSKMALLQAQVIEAGEKLFVLADRVKMAEKAMDGSAESTDTWRKAMKSAGDASDDLKKKTNDLVDAEIAAAKQVKVVADAIDHMRSADQLAAESQAAYGGQVELLTGKLYEQQQQLIALNKLADEAKAADDGAADAHERWRKIVEAAVKTARDMERTQEDLRKAQDKTKDSTSDLTTESVGYGIKLTQTVVPAIKESKEALDYATGAFHDNAAAGSENVEVMGDVSGAMGEVGASASTAADEVESLSAEIRRLTTDFLGLGEARSKSFSIGGAPSGYYYAVSNRAGGGYSVDLRPIPEGFEAGGSGIVPIPGYWDKKEKEGSSSGYSSGSYPSYDSPTYEPTATDTAAAGGSYPGVVIHQAAGEVLLVALASAQQVAAAAGSGGDTLAAVEAAASASEAASVTAMAVTTSSDVIRLVVSDLNLLTQIVAQTVQQTQQVASRLSMVSITNPGPNVQTASNDPNSAYYNPQPKPTGGGLSAGPTVTINNTPYPTSGPSLYPGLPGNAVDENAYDPSQYPYASEWAVPPPVMPSPAGAAAGIAVSVDMSNSTYGADMTASDVGNQVKQAVAESLTRVLRDQGARY